MNTATLVCLILGLSLLLARATVDLIRYIFQRGYEKGRKDATDYWLGIGKDVEEMQKEIRYEEEQN